jgi:hypothetical protein
VASEDDDSLRLPSAPALPASVSAAMRISSSVPPRPPMPTPAPLTPAPVLTSVSQPPKAGARWWVLGLVVLAVAVYFALRST